MRGMLGSPVGRRDTLLGRPPRQIACVRSEYPANTHGGNSSVGAWGTIPLTVVRYDPAGLVAKLYSDGTFDLQPGRYLVKGRCPVMNVNECEIRLFDVTRQVAACDGGSLYSYSGNAYAQTTLLLRGEANLTRLTRLALQEISGANESNWGIGFSAGVTGVNDVHSWLWLRRWNV